jgi:hypothetical protein
LLQVNVSVAIEILSRMGLWEKFKEEKSFSLTEIVDFTKADKIIIGN